MKNILTIIIICLSCMSALAQCESVGVQVSSSTVTSVNLYHAGFFLIPAGADNVIDWQVQEFDGTIVHEATTSGPWSEQSFSLFDHTVPITDSMAVMITIVNETSGITCVINDTLAYMGSIIEWAQISNNGGVETTVLGLNAITSSSISCFGGSDGTIGVEGLNGTPPYSFSIDDGPFGPDPFFNELIAGEHMITITDQDGSMASLTLTLSSPSELILEIAAGDVGCFGSNDGIIVASASGGTLVDNYDYFIDGAGPFESGTFEGLAAGSYTVSVQDFKDCITTQVIDVLQPDEIIPVEVDVTNVACSSDTNGAIDFNLVGGIAPFNYTIEGQATTTSLPITNLAAGQYTLTIQDNSSCSATLDFTIGAPDSLSITMIDIVNGNCSDISNGGVTISATGGTGSYTYTVGNQTNDTGVFDSLFVGDYIAMISDSAGCAISAAFDIGIDADFDVEYQVTDINCFGDSSGLISVIIEGGNEGFTFSLNGVETGSSEFTNLAAGDYEVIVAGADGCSSMATISIAEPEQLFLDSLTNIPVDCETGALGTVIITGVGGSGSYTFSLDSTSNTTGVFDNIDLGVYSIAVTDSLGCTSTISVLMQAAGDVNAVIADLKNVSCNGMQDGMVTIAVDSSSSSHVYQLDSMVNETGIFTDLAPGFYSVFVTSTLGCFTEFFVEIQDVETLETVLVEVTPDDGTDNGSITLSTAGGTAPYQYSIDGGLTFQTDATITGLSNDDYTVTVLDANGCSDMLEVTITFTSIEEIDQLTNIKVYPNPSAVGNGITVTSDVVIESITIHTADGQLITSKDYSSNSVMVSTDQLTTSLYLLGIKTREGTLWRRVIITD